MPIFDNQIEQAPTRSKRCPTRTLCYDAVSRLVALLGGGNAVETCAHNHEGRRIEIQDAAANVRVCVYDERSVLEAYDAGSLSRRYRYADRLIGLSTAAGSYALHLDPLGSILELTDQNSGDRSCCRITCTASGPCPMGMAIARCGGG